MALAPAGLADTPVISGSSALTEAFAIVVCDAHRSTLAACGQPLSAI